MGYRLLIFVIAFPIIIIAIAFLEFIFNSIN